MVSEGTNDWDFTVGTSSDNLATNKNTVNVKTSEACFIESIHKEMSNIVDTVEDRIENAIFTALDCIVAPKIELSIRSINASSGQEATSVTANSERGEHVGFTSLFENASGNNNVLHISNGNHETRNNIPDEVKELSVPEARFDRQTHIHHMVTVQTPQTNQLPEFITWRNLTPRNSASPQHQVLSTQVSQNNNLPMLEEIPRDQNLDTNKSINRLVDAIAGFATQQWPQAATILKPVSKNTLIFDRENKKFKIIEDLFHTMLKMQPVMMEVIEIYHLHAHLRKEALQTSRNISASDKKSLDDVLIVFRRKYVKPESQATAKHKWHKLTFDPNTKSLLGFLKELNECAERAFGDNGQHMIESLLYSKLPPHLKRSLNLAYLENGKYDQIVALLERELVLSGLENDGELTISRMTAAPSIDNQRDTEQTKIVCHYC